MNARQIINEVANSKDYITLCKNITKGNELWEDLFQELIIILCEKDPKVIEDLYQKKELKWFIVKILQNQYISKTSDFHKKYGFSQKTTEIIETKTEIYEVDNDYYNQIVDFEKQKVVFNNVGEWYENRLFLAYINEGSQRKLESKTGISRNAIKNTLDQYIQKLKDKAETKRTFMEKRFLRVQLPENIKDDIFTNSLYEEMTPEQLIIKQLQLINRILKIKNREKIQEKKQLRLF